MVHFPLVTRVGGLLNERMNNKFNTEKMKTFYAVLCIISLIGFGYKLSNLETIRDLGSLFATGVGIIICYIGFLHEKDGDSNE